MARIPVDVLKAEFPTDSTFEHDGSKMLGHCRELNAVTLVLWVLLSAGVGFDHSLIQVRIASQAGASGFLAGRALWQEAAQFSSREDRANFSNTVVVDRLRELAATAREHGRSWWSKYTSDSRGEGALPQAPGEDWYATF